MKCGCVKKKEDASGEREREVLKVYVQVCDFDTQSLTKSMCVWMC